METSAQSQDAQTLDFLSGLLVVLFALLLVVQFVLPSIPRVYGEYNPILLSHP